MVSLTLDPFIFSGFLSAFLASLCWMMVLTKFQLSYAYPFMSASFILVLFLSMFLFHESLNFHKLIGLSFIIIGLIISSKGL
ncbi:MAG: EamA family transporter [Deltaproteobacteria bacterium]|nr:EamA family transporter [Deltaproteobacteria bacterium]